MYIYVLFIPAVFLLEIQCERKRLHCIFLANSVIAVKINGPDVYTVPTECSFQIRILLLLSDAFFFVYTNGFRNFLGSRGT